MRLCSFLADGAAATHPGGTARPGGTVLRGAARPAVVSGPGTVIDLAAADPPLPADLGSLLSEERAGRLAAVAANAPETARFRLDQVRLAAPVPRPSKIIGIGLNYRDHAAETGQELPSRPTVFAKFPSTLSGPYDPIVLPALSGAVDYEGELGVVIGRRARSVPEDEALSYVGGYLAVNDVARGTSRTRPASGPWARASTRSRPWARSWSRRRTCRTRRTWRSRPASTAPPSSTPARPTWSSPWPRWSASSAP
jgi:2-keto-4-pentenoate hydratase/2-oxohepta-3-ene-1,7-dioic acid hydratase in catechol pathway